MIKLYALFSCAFLYVTNIHAQISLEQQTISSASNSFASNSIRIDWTIGEMAAVTTIGNSDFIFTQGLHQPDKFTVGINDLELNRFNVNLYPNPAVNEINLDLIGNIGSHIMVQIYDASGRQASETKKVFLSTDITKFNIPVEYLAQGAYFIHLSSENAKFRTAISFIKTFSYD
jgi:hypothetical protein